MIIKYYLARRNEEDLARYKFGKSLGKNHRFCPMKEGGEYV